MLAMFQLTILLKGVIIRRGRKWGWGEKRVKGKENEEARGERGLGRGVKDKLKNRGMGRAQITC